MQIQCLKLTDEMIDMVFREEDLNQDCVTTLTEKEEALHKFFLTA